MNKLVKLIENMPLEDLKLLKKDLDAGNINKLIHTRLESQIKNETGNCPVCGAIIKKNESFVLEFGKEIRKRAYFDELDCLNYFLGRLK
ncbi:MAG: hypothetical protein AB7V77_02545 [Candidatus Woesearchaeota archaeon]